MSIQRLSFPAALLSAALAGCASLPPDSGREDVTELLKARGRDSAVANDVAGVQALLAELATRSLTLNDAVRLTLVNNPRLKAEYARLGFSAADVYDAGRLSNPTFSAAVLIPNVSGASSQIGLGLVQSFTNVLLLPARSRFAEGEFERAKQLVGAEALNLAADSEMAYYRVVSARQMVTMKESIAQAAQASADLAQRYFDAGNINRLDLALEQASASQARLNVLKARADATVAQNDLNRVMGLGAGDNRWRVSAGLPMPLADEDSPEALLKAADVHRLDLAAARKRVNLFADALGVTRRTRFLGEIAVGADTQRETDGSRITGPTLSLELPLFNQGSGRVARAEANLQSAEAELRSLEIAISNGVQRAAAEVAAAKARAEQYRQSLIPLRESIVARTQERLNFMFTSSFELLVAKQQEYDAYQGYLEAVRDYWLARVELARDVGAPLPSSAKIGEASIDADALVRPTAEDMNTNDMRQHGSSQMNDMKSMDGMEMPMADMPGMDHKPAPADKPAPRQDSHGKKTGMEGMAPHQDGKEMPKHGKSKKPAQKKHADMQGMQHDMGDMKDMSMPDKTSIETKHGDHP